jgi:hypothetical protein
MFKIGDRMVCKKNVPGVPLNRNLVGSVCIYDGDEPYSHRIKQVGGQLWWLHQGLLDEYFDPELEEEII